MSGKVEFDTRALQKGVRQLVEGIDQGGPVTARRAADTAAANIRGRLPHRTGRLQSSVTVVEVPGGYGVAYGSGVSYARPVAARTGAVAEGIAGVPDAFARDMETMAGKEVGRL
jgi:hypothetical protein